MIVSESLTLAITDPITHEEMKDPVSLIPCGHSLSQETAELAHGTLQGGICPQRTACSLCRRVVTGYIPNYALRDVIAALAAAILPGPSPAESEREPITADSFPGIRARFFHLNGDYMPMDRSGFLNREITFTSETGGSLFKSFRVLGYRNRSIQINIEVKDFDTVAEYFKQLGIAESDTARITNVFSSINLEDARKMFLSLSRFNEIPREHYYPLKAIIDRGSWD